MTEQPAPPPSVGELLDARFADNLNDLAGKVDRDEFDVHQIEASRRLEALDAAVAELTANLASHSHSPITTTERGGFLDVDRDFDGDPHHAAHVANNGDARSPKIAFTSTQPYVFKAPLELTRGATIEGANGHATVFMHAPGYSGPIIKASGRRMNQLEGTEGTRPITTYSSERDQAGLELRNFSIKAECRDGVKREGIYLYNLDDARVDNVSMYMLEGTALKLGADEVDAARMTPGSGRIRECNFNDVNIYRCGAEEIPAFLLQSATGAGDGTNQIHFNNLRFVYNEGNGVIEGRNSSNPLRRIRFTSSQFHALADNDKWVPEKWFQLDFFKIIGNVREVDFHGLYVNGTAATGAIFKVGRSEHTIETPKRVTVDGVNVVNADGPFFDVEACDVVTVEGTGLNNAKGGIVVNREGSGLRVCGIHERGLSSPEGRSVGIDKTRGGTMWAFKPCAVR